jgi:hypothetical protein
LYDDIYDLPEEATYAISALPPADGYRNLDVGTRELTFSAYNYIDPPPSDANQSVNGPIRQNHPYESVVVDDDVVEYSSSKMYYEDGCLLEATDGYNKLTASTAEPTVPCRSASYTAVKSVTLTEADYSIESICEYAQIDLQTNGNEGYQRLVRVGQTSAAQAYEPLNPSDAFLVSSSGRNDAQNEAYVHLNSPPAEVLAEGLTSSNESREGYHKLDLSPFDEKYTDAKSYAPLISQTSLTACEYAQIDLQTNGNEGYQRLGLVGHTSAAQAYEPLNPSDPLLVSSSGRDDALNKSTGNDNKGYSKLDATTLEVETNQTAEVYIPLHASASQTTTSVASDEENLDYR